jgi:acetyltransferase
MNEGSTPTTLVLEDGTVCTIQLCVEPGSPHTPEFLKEQIIHALNSMSTRTRWLRFASSGKLTDEQLNYLTRLDGKDRVAWCASIRKNGKETGIGLSRYIKLTDEEDVAEFAVTVVDEYQGQGIGSALFKKILESARHNNISRLRGYVLASNKPMLSLCKHFEATIRAEDSTFLIAEILVNER